MTTSTESRVLFVDDSQNLLGAVRRMLRGHIDLVVAESAQTALQILETDPTVTVVVSDQNMPGMKGIEFLALVAERWPLVTRVMQTGNNDQDTAISAIHSGRVFRFLRKPYEPADLLAIINEAQAEHKIRKNEHTLLETTLATSVKLVTEMLALMRPDLFSESTKVHELARELAIQLKISRPWEISLAAMLYPLGLATLPESIIQKRKKGLHLNAAENFALGNSGVVAGQLVERIPKLERVATYLRYCRKGYDGSGFPVGEQTPDAPRNAVFLLPLLIEIVELAEIRDISLKDAALALADQAERFNPHLRDVVTTWLIKRAEEDGQYEHVAKELSIDKIRIGDVLVNDLLDENKGLLLTGGSVLTEMMIKRIQALAENHTIPRRLAVSRVNPAAARQSTAA